MSCFVFLIARHKLSVMQPGPATVSGEQESTNHTQQNQSPKNKDPEQNVKLLAKTNEGTEEPERASAISGAAATRLEPTQQNQTVTQNTQHLQKCVELLEKTNRETNAKCRNLEHANRSLEQTKQKLQLDVRTLENTTQNQAQTVERLENEIKSKDDLFHALQRERDALKDEKTNIMIELAQVRKDLEHSEKSRKKCESDLRLLNAEYEKCRSKSDESETKLAEYQIHMDYLRKDYDEIRSKKTLKGKGSTGKLRSGEHNYNTIHYCKI